MGWVNQLDRSVAYVLVDQYANIGQIYVPCFDTANARSALKQDFQDVMVGFPIVRNYRVALSNDTVFTPVVSDPLLSLKNIYRVTALNTTTGYRETLDLPGANLALLPAGTELANLGAEPFLSVVEGLQRFWNAPTVGVDGPMIVEQIKYVSG